MRKILLRKARAVPAWGIVCGLFVLSVVIRALLAFLFSSNPSIMPDESLYINLMRSLFISGEATLRGQPVTYDSLLYPLFLAPLNLLPPSVDLFRAVQVMNASLISLSVFPAFLLARRIAGERAALGVAALTLLMPDMAMSEITMADSLCYPLMLWALYAIYRTLTDGPRIRDAVLAAALCALLYMAKPGYIALGIALLLALAIRFVRERNEKNGLCAFSVLMTLAALLCLARIAGAYVLGINYGHTSIYQDQMSGFSITRVLTSLNGIALYLYSFPAALCIYPIALPIAHSRALRPGERAFLWTTVTAALMVIIGTAYVIYMDEYTGVPLAARVHLRYLAGFVPVFAALSLSPALRGAKLNSAMGALLAWMLAATIAFSPEALLSNRSYPVDALMLSAATNDTALTQPKTILQLILILLIALGGFLLWRGGWQGKLKKGVFALLVAMMVLHNVSAYDMLRHNNDGAWAADAQEAAETIAGKSTLLVAEDGGYFWMAATALDARARDILPVVELVDLIGNTGAGGVYAEFVPRDYWTTLATRRIAQPKVLVMDNQLLNRLALTADVSITPTENAMYVILEMPEDGSWVHSALSGFSSGWTTDASGLTLFDETLCAGSELTVKILAAAYTSGARLSIGYGDESETFALGTDAAWIEWTVEIPGDGAPIRLTLTSPDGVNAVRVDSYLVSGV